MSLEVLGVGVSRTGTTSLYRALQQLKLAPAYHGGMHRMGHAKKWLALMEDPEHASLKFLHKFRSSAGDTPFFALWEPLAKRIPDAKVILTVRNPADWYDSYIEALYSRWTDKDKTNPHPLTAWVRKKFFHNLVGPDHRTHMINTFMRHVDAVYRTIDTDRLLIFDVREGWGPLCTFLERPIPNTKFPHANFVQRVKT